jgi:hypothetical protein
MVPVLFVPPLTPFAQEKETDMRRRLACLVLLSVTSVFTALSNAGKVWATSAVGFTSTTLVHGEHPKRQRG